MSLIELSNPQQSVQIELYMNGSAFEAGIPVHLLHHGFEATQTILDKAYLVLANKTKLTAEERKHFYLLSKGVKHSSLDSYMDIVLTGVQTTFPILGALGPAGIWEYAKEAYELLKFAYEAVKEDVQPTYQVNNNGHIEVNNGQQTQVYNAPVYNIAKLTQKTYIDMAKQVTDGSITLFSLNEAIHHSGIVIAQNEASFFNIPSTIEVEPIEIDCEIFDFNKFEDTGKLRVFENQVLPSKDYRFEVVGKQADSQYIEAMLRKSVKITCLKEIIVDPLETQKIVKLQVLKVA